MQYRRLGHSGLNLSVIGLGSWLTYGGNVGAQTARACVLRAWERGVNFIDTANVYARGGAEEVLGPILKELNRDILVLATKVYFPMGETVNERGLSRKHVHAQTASFPAPPASRVHRLVPVPPLRYGNSA